MSDMLLIVDGATDPEPSCLMAARTPALDALRTRGTLRWLDLLDPGVPVGSETAIASLLGWRPPGGVDRARVEAAARGLPGTVRRVDLPAHGHRLLVFGDAVLSSPHDLREWPGGAVPPRILDSDTVVVGATGAATGLGALMGASVITPAGATGQPGSDLAAKRHAALGALRAGARRTVVHVGGADAAGHRRDRALKIAELERIDAELIGPLAQALAGSGATLTVLTDHGCDPATGAHTAGPVPSLEVRCL